MSERCPSPLKLDTRLVWKVAELVVCVYYDCLEVITCFFEWLNLSSIAV